jgi:hypothetical protein
MRGQDGWAPPGFIQCAKWDAMWKARGPLVECGPWGIPLYVAEPTCGQLPAALSQEVQP